MSKSTKADPTGYRCECGAEHTFPGYVFAHWREDLTHTCEKCGARHNIVCGMANREDTGERAAVLTAETKKTRPQPVRTASG